MTDISSDAIVQRIERLERESRRWRGLALTLGLLLAAGGVLGQASVRRTVEAQRFVLKDAGNRVRAELVAQDRSVALRFKDENGAPRLTVGIEDGAAVLVLNEKSGRLVANFVALANGAPGLTLFDPAGKPRVELSVTREGVPSISTRQRNGTVAWKAP